MSSLQIFITYTPVVNTTIIGQSGMDGIQWAIVVGFMFVTFVGMELEKAVCRYLSSLGKDTDDLENEPTLDAPIRSLSKLEPFPPTSFRDDIAEKHKTLSDVLGSAAALAPCVR